MSKKYKHNIASTIWISLFFFLSVCIWSSSSQASITTYTQSSSLHTTGAKLQKRVLSFSCSQHYRCCCFYFYLLYYYYFLCTLVLSLSLFLFYSGYVVVLATTTTGFPFLFFLFFFFSFFLSPLFSVDANIVSYQQTHYSADWLLQEGTWRWTNISRHRTEERERGRRLPRCSLSPT